MALCWVSCPKFTVGVTVDASSMITGGPPFVRRFVGQPLGNLLRWARRFGDVRHEYLP